MILTEDELRRQLRYDPLTGEFVWLVSNNRHRIGDRAGGLMSKGYVRIGVNGLRYHAQNLAWLYMTGSLPEHDIDHKDLNRANNVWSNLRSGTRSQNCGNTGIRINNTSGFKGVTWAKREGKWLARVKVNYRNIFLGYFDVPEDAHVAYVAAAQEHFGEFARDS